MTWRLALVAEVLERLHDAGTEKSLPPAVDSHPCCERILARHEPPGECQPVCGLSLGQLRQKRWHRRRHLFLGLRVFPAMVPMRDPRIVGGPLRHHECPRALSLRILQPANLGNGLRQLRCRLEKPAKDQLLFGVTSLLGRHQQGCLYSSRVPSARRPLCIRHRKAEAAQRAGVVPLKPHRDLQRLPGWQWLGQHKHGCMGPALLAVGRPAARHLSVDRSRGPAFFASKGFSSK